MSDNSGGGAGATTAQLKADIDFGRTGDKVSGHDPAASPLGADDEAAATPPSPAVAAHARAREAKPELEKHDPDRTAAPKTSIAPDARSLKPPSGIGAGVVWGVLAAVIVAVVLWLAFAL